MNAVYPAPSSMDGAYQQHYHQQQQQQQQQQELQRQQAMYYHQDAMPFGCVPSHAPLQPDWRPLPFATASAFYAHPPPPASYYAVPAYYHAAYPQQQQSHQAQSRFAFATGAAPTLTSADLHYAAHEAWMRQASAAQATHDASREARSRWASNGSWGQTGHAHPSAAAHERWSEESISSRELQISKLRSIWTREAGTDLDSPRAFIVTAASAESHMTNELEADEIFHHNEQQPIVIPNADEHAPVEYDLIAPMSAVPPPPSIEHSAVPLADLATEMTWAACLRGANNGQTSNIVPTRQRTSPPRSRWSNSLQGRPVLNDYSKDEIAHPVNRGSSRSSPHTPELFFGAIGDGRVPRKVSSMSLDDGFMSDESSPENSAPGTPHDLRVAGFGLGDYEQKHQVNYASPAIGDDFVKSSLDEPVEIIRTHTRRVSSKPAAVNTPQFPLEPSPAFRQFVKQLLTATLVAPEDIALALYYVSRIPTSSIIPSEKAEEGGANARAHALKAAPFKILLGALMLANKTLQDNSYRNETFATVSGIPLKDVNELEIHVFSALNFDVSIEETVWRVWLGDMSRHAQSSRGDVGSVMDVDRALGRLQRAIARGSDTSSTPSSPQVGVPMSILASPRSGCEKMSRFLPSLPTPMMQSRNAALFEFDLDSSGPRRPLVASSQTRSTWSDQSAGNGSPVNAYHPSHLHYEHRRQLC